MSYVRPSVLVYQDLKNAGGVLNSTPDLECAIIGPVYNVLTYIPDDVTAQVKTAAYSTTSTTGSIVTGSQALTVASTGGFNVNDSILIIGAGTDGTTLQALVTDITGNIMTIDTAAKADVTDANVKKTGKIANAAINNTFGIPGVKPGQDIDSTSFKIWISNAKVETMVTGCECYYTDNTLTVTSVATTGDITTGTVNLTVASTEGLVVGDTVTVAGAGAGGSTLTAKLVDKVGSVFTLDTAAGTTVTTAAVTKVAPVNLNSTTNTLRAEAGDDVYVTYTNTSSVSTVWSSQIKEVNTTSGLNGSVTNLQLVDMLPSDISYQTTGGIITGTATLTVASGTGFAIGKKVIVYGAGTAGADLVTTISNVAGTTITLAANAGTTVAGAAVVVFNKVTISVRKSYNNQLIPSTKPLTGGSSFDVSTADVSGTITVLSGPELVYGPIVSGDIFIGYKALRKDLINRVLTINDVNDLVGQLGEVSDENPLALGCQLALANTIGRVRAISVPTNDLLGYQNALEVAEGERLYYLVPLTQEEDILASFSAHVQQLSVPEQALWRVAIVNTEMPLDDFIGSYTTDYVNANGGNNNVTIIAGKYVLTASNATFISDGVAPGDFVHFTAATPSGQIGVHQVLQVVSNQQLVLDVTTTSTAVSYYVTRTMSKTQTAQAIKAKSEVFGSNRVWHIQPDIVGVSVGGVTKYLPGYYLCCAVAGMGAGFPVQQGFTNIGAAGIADIKHSNFYFTRADLNTMAEGGTCLFVQETELGIPYCRHELTTDVTVLEYREMMVVKTWDFLSYFYYDKLKGFIGKYNIVPETINIIRQTIIAASELVKSKKLPKLGAPLVEYKITKIEQNAYNKDNLDVNLEIKIPYPLNYLNLHLII